MELTTSWKEEGRAEGKIEAREETRQHQAGLILHLLRKRFGPLEGDLEAQVKKYSFDRLDALGSLTGFPFSIRFARLAGRQPIKLHRHSGTLRVFVD